jgi:RluA family pseudouridine synthase
MLKAKIGIIYQDDDILVVNKPAGVSVTKDRTGAAEFVDVLADEFGPNISSKVRLVHRLDKGTSGIMILARNKEAQSLFCSLFEKKLVKKTYLALVTGAISAQRGTISAPLAHSRKKPALMCIAAKKGKEAVTDWELLADFGIAALLGVSPLTGRTHQIRVHLSSIGMPLLIDPLYGNSKAFFLSDFKADYRLGKGKTETPLIERLTLHAYQIQLTRLKPSLPDCFVAGLDRRFTACLKMLAKHNSRGPDAFIKADNFSKIINNKRLY